jgi:hypothetical protein
MLFPRKKISSPKNKKKSPDAQAQCSLTGGGKKQVLDERHSGNKNLKAVLNDVFRQCAAIVKAVLEIQEIETWKLGHSGCLNTPLQVSVLWIMPRLYEMRSGSLPESFFVGADLQLGKLGNGMGRFDSKPTVSAPLSWLLPATGATPRARQEPATRLFY